MPVTFTFPGPGPSTTSGTSKYPNAIDDQLSMPLTVDLVTPINAIVVNRLRDAILSIESELGTQPSREFGTVRARIDSIISELTTIKNDINTLEEDVAALEAALDTIVISANQIDASQRITVPLALNETVATNTYTSIGGDTFNPSSIPNPSGSRKITFNANISTSVISVAAEIRLYNVTDGALVTGTEFSSTSLTPDFKTVILTVPADLPNAEKIYEVQLRTATAGAVVAFCQKAEFIITWI
jgi:hypothetical protein